MIVTDCPDADFFMQLRRLLPQWPNNLNNWPILFSTWAMGDAKQPELQQLMESYYGPGKPLHHALHDAHALHLAVNYALENGWKPDL